MCIRDRFKGRKTGTNRSGGCETYTGACSGYLPFFPGEQGDYNGKTGGGKTGSGKIGSGKTI